MKLITTISLCFIFVCSAACYSQSLKEQLNIDESFELNNEQYQPKSPTLAGALSVGTTVTFTLAGSTLLKNNKNISGGILLSAGLLLGPSAGNIYAGNGAGVGKGIGTRLVAGGVASLGGLLIVLNDLDTLLGGEPSTDYSISGSVLVLGGAGLFIYSTIHDWIRGAQYAEEINRRHTKVQVAPGVDAYTGKPTLGLNIRF